MLSLVLNRYLGVVNLLLAGLLVILLGASAKDAYEMRFASEVVPVGPERTEVRLQPSLSRPRPRGFYDAITQRDIFNLAPAPTPPIENEDLHIKLLGTSHLTTGEPFAIIEDQAGHQSLFRQGDAIPGVGRLLEVAQDQMVVLHNGHRVKSEIPPDQTNVPEVNAATPNLVNFGGKMFHLPGS